MKRSAKLFCAFGLIEMVSCFIAAFLFAHIPFPWAFNKVHRITEVSMSEIEKDVVWQAHAIMVCFLAGIVGLIYLIGGCLIYLISKLQTENSN